MVRLGLTLLLVFCAAATVGVIDEEWPPGPLLLLGTPFLVVGAFLLEPELRRFSRRRHRTHR